MTIEKIFCTCYSHPNQFEGVVDGKAFYFRARGGVWSLRVNERGASDDEMFEWPIVASGTEEDGPDGSEASEDVEPFVRELLNHYSGGACPHCGGTGRAKTQ